MSFYQIPEIDGFTANVLIEIDLEYDNGFRETVVIEPGVRFQVPFDGRIVGMRVPTAVEPGRWKLKLGPPEP